MAIASLAAFGPLIEYLRPSKSPYLLMVLFGAISIAWTTEIFANEDEWPMLIIPQYIALVIFSLFAFFGKCEVSSEEQEEQLRFSRAISIAVALMCLTYGASVTTDKNALFNFNYFACLFQLTVFAIYTAARLYKEDKASNFNFFQFAFVTSVYLVSATYTLSYIDYADGSYIMEEPNIDSYFISCVIFYLLWAACQIYWVKRIFFLVNISVRDE